MTATVEPSEIENVVLLTIDALRADHLSCFNYPRTTSPNIDRISNENIQFSKTISASSHTREAVPSLLTGLYPDEAIDDQYSLAAPTVAQYLSAEGLQTGAFHSNPFLSRGYGYAKDFDMFYDDLYIGRHKLIALFERAIDKVFNRHYARAQTINDLSLDWLTTLDNDQSYFLWNHYMDVHGPYEPPERYQELFRDNPVSKQTARKLYKQALKDPESISTEEHQLLIDLYDAEIRYLDEYIGDFIESVTRLPGGNDTLIIITSDHGEAFGEHGYYEHPRYLHDELLHVPLIIYHPKFNQGTVNEPTSTLDIAPTIYDVVGLNHKEFPGESLFDIVTTPDAYSDRVVFASATGEKTESHLRRVSARTKNGAATLVCGPDQEVINTKGEQELVAELKDFNSNRTQYKKRSADEDPIESAQISERLQALGYRE